jgi:hypothetical protein
MRFKASLAKGLLIALAISLIPVFASSATKVTPGSKCKVQKQKVDYQNKTYTCIKSGKKLVWNKGLVIVKKEPSPTPTPSPTPIPTQSKPVIIETNWQALYRKTLNSLEPNSIESLQIEAIYSPTVNVSKANALLEIFKDALALYVNRFGPNKKVIFVFMSESDKNWYDQKVIFYEGADTGDDWWGTHCEFTARSQCGRGTNVALANLYYELVGSAWDAAWIYAKVSPNHEAVHAYQKSIIGDGMYRILPPWFGEGQANFLGFVTSYRFLDVSSLRSAAIKDLSRGFPNYLQMNSSEWLSAITRVDSDIDFTFRNGLGYSLGMLISEYLYLKYSPDQVDNLLIDVTSGMNWDLAIQSNFGLAKSQLYKAASDYVYSEIQEAIKE